MLSRPLRAVRVGYQATWLLVRRSAKRPFGEASAWHRAWLLPQLVVVLGLMPLVGAAQGDWEWPLALLISALLLLLGLSLTAAVGRAVNRGSLGAD